MESIKSDCDHTMAHGYEDFWGGFIKVSEMDEKSIEIIEAARDWYNNDGGYRGIKDGMEKWTNTFDFIDDEITVFSFCPKCGAGIDWSKYKEQEKSIKS